MTSLETAIAIAGSVLKEARHFDRNTPVDKDAVIAWGRIFEGQQIWPNEALDAVRNHFRQEVTYPLKPGDVLAYCKRQPVWSSPEHASWALDMWAQYPYSTAIVDYTGIQPPEFQAPERIPDSEIRAWLVERLAEWGNANRDELINAIIRRKHKVVEQ